MEYYRNVEDGTVKAVEHGSDAEKALLAQKTTPDSRTGQTFPLYESVTTPGAPAADISGVPDWAAGRFSEGALVKYAGKLYIAKGTVAADAAAPDTDTDDWDLIGPSPPSGDSGAAKLDGSNMPFTGEVDIDTPAGLWVYDSANSGPFSNVAPDGSITSNRATPGSVFRGTVAGDGADRVNFDTDGMAVGDGTTPPDTSFRRHAAGVWDIPEVGGGIRFTSPNGLVSKVLSIDNSGNPVWT